MSGPNVVDKAKMVFHYVAKIAARPSNSSDIPEPNASREMKVCFRHSKHSIKCDINAPCLECDSGLKLYSYEQCRRHLDVVRSERRFESIEVDRSENMIEKLSDIDENGKKVVQLLEVFISKQDQIFKGLSDLSSHLTESQNKSESFNNHPKHESEEEKISRETMNCTLKEISKNTLKSQKKQEELFEQLAKCISSLADLNASALLITNNQVLGHSKLSDANTHLNSICLKIEENTNNLKDANNCQTKAFNQFHKNNEKLFEEISQIKSFLTGFVASLKQELDLMRKDLINELKVTRSELIDSQNQLRTDLLTNICSVRDEVHSFKNLSQSFANDLKDGLPEKLMDVFGSILMLSTENNRKLDNNDECGTANSSFTPQFHLNNKNEY